MHHILSKLLFILILFLLPLAEGLPYHKDLMGESYQGGTPPNSRTTLDYQFGFIMLPVRARSTASGQGTTCADPGTLIMSLTDSILRDTKGRRGSIAANRRLEFDNPPLPHDLLSGGYSVGEDGILALGHNDIFYACPCGRGPWKQLYEIPVADYCYPALLEIMKITDC